MIKYYLNQTLCLLYCFSLMLIIPSQTISSNNGKNAAPTSVEVSQMSFSHSQIFIKVATGFDIEADEDITHYANIQKMLFELHKLVNKSELISVKKPSFQLTSSKKNNLYVFEFDAVGNINDLIKKVQDLPFIDDARKVPTK